MKKSFLKFACIFIIAMFCLTPLGAIDLNHGGNTKYVNQENETNSLVDDSNFTGIDINPAEDLDNDGGSDNKTKVVNGSDINPVNCSDVHSSQVNLSKAFPDLRARIADIDYGEVPVVEVWADEGLLALIRMECPDFIGPYGVGIENGYMKYQFHEYDLKPGTYEVKIYTIGTSKFDPQEITTTFTVRKLRPNFNIKYIDNITYGKDVVINVNADKRFNGTANIKLNNSKTVPIKFVDGFGSVKIANLAQGQYDAVVDYDGDDIFAPARYISNFTVFGNADPELSVSVADIQ